MESVKNSKETLESVAKEHLALRFDWARAVAEARGEDFTEALAHNTDLYARIFGIRRPTEEVLEDPRWQDFTNRIKKGADPVELAYRIRERRKREQGATSEREFFGPFRYDYDGEQKEIHIHFGSMGWSEEERDAPADFAKDLKIALEQMFRAIKERHPDARTVAGGSWLFTRLLSSDKLKDEIRAILPPSFVDSGELVENRALGGGLWGQFVDNRGRLHKKRAEEFRRRMQDPELMKGRLADVFPLHATYLEGPISDFYTFYGIE